MYKNLKGSQFDLKTNVRATVHDAICSTAASNRFYVDALNVRTNHVHAVVCAFDGRSAEQIVAIMKLAAGREIRKKFVGADDLKMWTKSFSVYEIRNIASWRNRVRYTLFKQGSNSYMSHTQFAKLRGIEFDECGEPTGESLCNAFHCKNNEQIRANLFYKKP